MGLDIQVVHPQESIRLNNVRFASIDDTPSVEILGQDFTAVDEVLINGTASPSVVVLSSTFLIAQLPSNVATATDVVSVQVLSKRLTLTKRSVLSFRIGRTPGRVSGLYKLIQQFLKVLFTTPGSDIFNQSMGGGALKSIGKTYGGDQGGSIVSDFILAVNQTARQITARQARDTSLAVSERLLTARVLSSNFDKTQGALFVSVEIQSQAGQAAVINAEV
jgi:hypothetical protein